MDISSIRGTLENAEEVPTSFQKYYQNRSILLHANRIRVTKKRNKLIVSGRKEHHIVFTKREILHIEEKLNYIRIDPYNLLEALVKFWNTKKYDFFSELTTNRLIIGTKIQECWEWQ
jgi:hypothetical protein